MKVRLAYGAGGLEVELPEERTTVVEPAYHAGAPDERGGLRRALQEPVAGPPLRELARPGEGRDLDVRRHPRPAARQDDPGRPGGAGRARRRRRDPRRHRHPPRQHPRGDPGDARRRRRRARAGRQPRRPRRRDADLPRRARQRRPGVDQPRVGRGRRAHHHRLRRAALLRRLQRRPEGRTPGLAGLDTVMVLHNAARIGDPNATWGGSRATPCTTTSARRAPRRRRTSSFNVAINSDSARSRRSRAR